MHQPSRTYVPLFLQTVKIYIFQSDQSPSGPVYTWKKLQVFRIHRTFLIWTWKHISKTTRRKGYVYHPERILDDTLSTIHGFPPCLAADEPHHDDQHLRTLILQTVKIYICLPNITCERWQRSGQFALLSKQYTSQSPSAPRHPEIFYMLESLMR